MEGFDAEGSWDCCASGEDCLNGSNAKRSHGSVRKRKDVKSDGKELTGQHVPGGLPRTRQ